MSAINLEIGEMTDLIVLILLTKMDNEGFLSSNKEFNKLMRQMKVKGVRQDLFNYFFSIDSEMRTKFGMIKNTLSKEKEGSQIILKPTDKKKLVEDVVLKVVQEMVKKENPNPKKLKVLTEKIEKEFCNG